MLTSQPILAHQFFHTFSFFTAQFQQPVQPLFCLSCLSESPDKRPINGSSGLSHCLFDPPRSSVHALSSALSSDSHSTPTCFCASQVRSIITSQSSSTFKPEQNEPLLDLIGQRDAELTMPNNFAYQPMYIDRPLFPHTLIFHSSTSATCATVLVSFSATLGALTNAPSIDHLGPVIVCLTPQGPVCMPCPVL